MRTSSTYRGSPAGKVTVDGVPLEPRNDLRNHSPGGFAWGYGGSGPAQLALAILADFLQDDAQALKAYQQFQSEVVAAIPSTDAWSMTGEQIASSSAVRGLVASGVMEE